MRCLFSCQLICTVTSPLDWPWKTFTKWPPKLWKPSTGSEVMEMCFPCQLICTVTLPLDWPWKNYPKMALGTLKFVHWIRSYGGVFFHVSWCVQWPHYWIDLKMTPDTLKYIHWNRVGIALKQEILLNNILSEKSIL